MIVLKTEPFKTLIVSTSGCTEIYHYNTFEEFVNILKDNFYSDIMYQKEFKQ